MTHLRKITLEELVRRNYSESTTRAYSYTIEDFARYFHCPPDQLGPEQIREYVAHLFRERKLAENTVLQRVGALRFFFVKTLRRSWNIEDTPYPKKIGASRQALTLEFLPSDACWTISARAVSDS